MRTKVAIIGAGIGGLSLALSLHRHGLLCDIYETVTAVREIGVGITLLPELAIGVEERGRDITLVRFVDPEPSRTIGLVWRSTSPRAQDFEELGRLVSKAWNDGPLAALRTGARAKKSITAAGS